jgi:hypothetical protein
VVGQLDFTDGDARGELETIALERMLFAQYVHRLVFDK